MAESKNFFLTGQLKINHVTGILTEMPRGVLTKNVIPTFSYFLKANKRPIKKVTGFMASGSDSGGGGEPIPTPVVENPRRFPYSFIPRR